MSPSSLRQYTCKDLAQMARKKGVSGWHSMRKDQLIRALLKAAKKRRPAGTKRSKGAAAKKGAERPSGNRKSPMAKASGNARVRRKISQMQDKLDEIKNLAAKGTNGQAEIPENDRLVVMVRDPFWLHVVWELCPASVERARAAMGQHWYAARPALRVLKELHGESTAVERTIFIHGGVNHWYVDVADPPSRYRAEIGYITAAGEFRRVARSNVVTTPPAGLRDSTDDGWPDLAENAERIYAMSGGYAARGGNHELQELLEERLGRPVGSPMDVRFGAGAQSPFCPSDDFHLAVDAEMIVFGVTKQNAYVTLNGEPVRLQADGTFAVRLDMPERRQVIPIVASSSDGVEQRTISIAVERNTKVMEPVVRDPGD